MTQQAPEIQRKASYRHPLAFTAALLTLLMICFGATVTTIEAGDSDPEWSWRFWEWFRDASGGLWYELMHRQIGTVIGFVGIALVVSLWRTEPRRWVRRLGYGAFALIVVQGLIGGLRIHVVSNPDVQAFMMRTFGLDHAGIRLAVAVFHAFNAQVVFSLLVALAVVTSRAWDDHMALAQASPKTGKSRRLILWTGIMLFLQLVLGAYIRHGRVFYPDEPAPLHDVMTWVHIGMAIGVVGHIFLVNSHTRQHHPDVFPVWHLAGLAKFLVMVQLFLGFGAWAVTRPISMDAAMPWDVAMLVRTGHVANGAMIFAILVTMTARAYRLLRKPNAESELSQADSGLERGAHA